MQAGQVPVRQNARPQYPFSAFLNPFRTVFGPATNPLRHPGGSASIRGIRRNGSDRSWRRSDTAAPNGLCVIRYKTAESLNDGS